MTALTEPDPGDADFGASYWRRSAPMAVPELPFNPGAVDVQELRLLAQLLPTLCSIADATGSTIWCNRRWFDYCGTTLAEMAGDGWHGVHDPRELPNVLQRWEAAVRDGAAFEMVVSLRGADRRFRPFLTRAWPLHGPAGEVLRWFVVSTEIGAQIAAEAALRRENDAHLALIATQQAIAATPDPDRMLQAVVQGALQACVGAQGVAIDLLQGEALVRAAAAGTAMAGGDQHLACTAGLSRLCLSAARPLICEDAWQDARVDQPTARALELRSVMVVPMFRRGQPAGVLKLLSGAPQAFGERDLAVAQLLAGALAAGFADAAEADAARALRESESRFELITNSVGHMIWSAPADGYPDFFSEQWQNFVGGNPGRMRVRDRLALMHPDDHDKIAAIWSRCLATGAPYEADHRLRFHDGSYRWVFSRATKLTDHTGSSQRWYGTTTDIHDRRMAEDALRELNDTLEQRIAHEVAERAKAEAAFRQAQKMEAVGQLTGGIAHDFNNLLTVIAGNIEIATRALDAGDPQGRAFRALEGAMKGAERASVLTQGLLAFARLQPLAPRALGIRELIAGMSDLLTRALGERIRLVVQAGPTLWPVEADHNQLENAILNLAVNARDAMPSGGTLTILAENAVFDAAQAAPFTGLKPGEYAVISVSDTGIGMPPEVMARVFEPFFTTKEVGRGTGLGLSQVYGFVKQSGGYIRLNSEPGHGTIVRIYLPRLAGEAEADVVARDAVPAPARHRETVLVVEDDADVRMFSVECVRELGYIVLEAEDGATALAVMRAHAGTIDLLFTDIVMPGMSGVDLAAAAVALRPALKVLYTSGYTRDAMGPHERAAADLLTKPFTFAALSSKLRDVLEGRGAHA